MPKKKVSASIKLSSLSDFQQVAAKHPEASPLKLISARHWELDREHGLKEEIGDFEYPQETIETYMAAKNLDEETARRRANYMNPRGFLVLQTDTAVYFAEVSNEQLEPLEYVRAKEVAWRY